MFALNRRKFSVGRASCRKFSKRFRKSPFCPQDAAVKATTFDENRTNEALTCLRCAMECCGVENELATYMKRRFDAIAGPTWHCVVGRNFGSHIVCREYIHMTIANSIFVLLFRIGRD